jgi:acyl-coenzyme A thioesterase PaaI-like protein
LVTDERHLQQHGHVHAGVVATLADHAAGGAARSSVQVP